MAANAQINLREDPLRYAVLHETARALGVTVSELAREALENMLPTFQKRAAELAAKHSPANDDEVGDALESLGKTIARGSGIMLNPTDVHGAKGRAVYLLLAAAWGEETRLTDIQKRRINKITKSFNDA